MTPDEEDVSFLPMNVDFMTQLHKLDKSVFRLYLLAERNGNVALRVSSGSPLTVEVIPEDESAANLGFIRFVRAGDLGEDWEIDSIQRNDRRYDNEHVRELFHACWTGAIASPDYKKSEWKLLRSVLGDLGYEL